MTTIDLGEQTDVPGTSPGLSAYVATPAGTGPWPGVVVLHEIFGDTPQMRRQTDRLAAAGYLAILPDLFSAGGARRCLVATFRALRSGHGRALQDVDAAREWLRANESCTGRIGVIGFCMGGGFALLAVNRGFDASSVNYGQLPQDLDPLLAGACPVVGSFGGRDRTLKGAATRLEEALTRHDVPHDVKEYPRAGHAFIDEQLDGPRILHPVLTVLGVGPEPESAADAWRRIDAFFAEHLHGPADGRR